MINYKNYKNDSNNLIINGYINEYITNNADDRLRYKRLSNSRTFPN